MNIPEGWPTEEMLEEGREAMLDDGFASDAVGKADLKSVFTRMLEAAPTPPMRKDDLRGAAEELEDAVRYLEGTEIEYPKAIRLSKALKNLRVALEKTK